MERREILDGYRMERERLIDYLGALAPEQWERPSSCEGWRVRDVAAHLAGNAADVVAGRLEGAGSAEYNQRQVDERAHATPSGLLDELRAAGAKLDEFLAGLPPETWDAKLPGIGTVGFGVMRLLEDLWVHAHDVRLPLGDDAVAGPGLRATLETLAATLPARARALAPSLGSIEIEAGGFTASISGLAGDAELRVSCDPIALALAATGRRSLEDEVAAGRIVVKPEVPAGFGDALNLYGPAA